MRFFHHFCMCPLRLHSPPTRPLLLSHFFFSLSASARQPNTHTQLSLFFSLPLHHCAALCITLTVFTSKGSKCVYLILLFRLLSWVLFLFVLLFGSYYFPPLLFGLPSTELYAVWGGRKSGGGGVGALADSIGGKGDGRTARAGRMCSLLQLLIQLA